MSTLKRRLTNAYHNIVLHPIAGLLWLFGFQAWGDRVHGTEKPRWWIITFEKGDGPQMRWASELEPRPADARPDNGDPFTPWYENRQHLHPEAGGLMGCHVYAENKEEAYRQAVLLLALELSVRPSGDAETVASAADEEGYW